MTSNKIAIVTGVSRLKGIGRAICVYLAINGIDIFFTYWCDYDKKMPWRIENDEPEKIQNEIIELGVRCDKLEIDLMQEESIRTLLNHVEKSLGNPSILINNATYSTQTDISNITAKELDNHYNVNLKATILLTVNFVKRFKTGQSGRIINLTSGQSLSAMSNEIAYAVTKGAIETFTRTMQHEFATKNITINAINPGLTDSGWLDEKQRDVFINRFPMGRFGLPSDVSKLIAFLVSDNAEWITGQIIHSEGGFIREQYDNQ